MARIMAWDHGGKRTGIAVTDPLRIIANGLTTVPTRDLLDWLAAYRTREEVDLLVIGMPLHADGNPTDNERAIRALIPKIEKRFPDLEIDRVDERASSIEAVEAMVRGGMRRSKRRDKALIDQVSATIILQRYMDQL